LHPHPRQSPRRARLAQNARFVGPYNGTRCQSPASADRAAPPQKNNAMLIRPYTESDLDALLRIHAAQGFDYAFPNLDDPLFVSKIIVEDDAGLPTMAALARLTCEMYLLADPDAGTPRTRFESLLALHQAGASDLRARGLEDAHAWLPPRISRRFGRRLAALGWIRDDAWTPYCKRLAR
jgi:hypothetical protein